MTQTIVSTIVIEVNLWETCVPGPRRYGSLNEFRQYVARALRRGNSQLLIGMWSDERRLARLSCFAKSSAAQLPRKRGDPFVFNKLRPF